MATVPQMIFFHVGWMKGYRGEDDNDPTMGPHEYLLNNRFGHECYNFFPRSGSCYGYVPTQKGIDISKWFGASSSADYVDDVVCVWVAKDPVRKTRVIVGWYKAARVFRSSNPIVEPSGNTIDGQDIVYRAVAAATECTLIPVSRRTFRVPSRKGGLGRSTVWYGGNDEFREKVWAYINRWDERRRPRKRGSKSQRSGGGGRNRDPEVRQKIERLAVCTAINFFSSKDGGGYKVKSREKDNVGWDLEARSGSNEILLIEVKGLSGKEVSVELTPNEYKQMVARKNRNNYVLFVVTDCLGKSPLTHDFRFKDGGWFDVDGTELDIKERTGALCRSKR